ncbi:hypothetical protein CHS0354_018788 [Potamilus streckersoni]|uniref:Uncharacterized protein n=1 Tax=Potamilus streckersoni TaxID=2493646 RepID=A0AAE0WAD4_9BIVA|nr:hypothetical protein CHS0354_018788 [Potamilus streckersoni]
MVEKQFPKDAIDGALFVSYAILVEYSMTADVDPTSNKLKDIAEVILTWIGTDSTRTVTMAIKDQLDTIKDWEDLTEDVYMESDSLILYNDPLKKPELRDYYEGQISSANKAGVTIVAEGFRSGIFIFNCYL